MVGAKAEMWDALMVDESGIPVVDGMELAKGEPLAEEWARPLAASLDRRMAIQMAAR